MLSIRITGKVLEFNYREEHGNPNKSICSTIIEVSDNPPQGQIAKYNIVYVVDTEILNQWLSKSLIEAGKRLSVSRLVLNNQMPMIQDEPALLNLSGTESIIGNINFNVDEDVPNSISASIDAHIIEIDNDIKTPNLDCLAYQVSCDTNNVIEHKERLPLHFSYSLRLPINSENKAFINVNQPAVGDRVYIENLSVIQLNTVEIDKVHHASIFFIINDASTNFSIIRKMTK